MAMAHKPLNLCNKTKSCERTINHDGRCTDFEDFDFIENRHVDGHSREQIEAAAKTFDVRVMYIDDHDDGLMPFVDIDPTCMNASYDKADAFFRSLGAD